MRHVDLATWRDCLPTLTYEHRRKLKSKDERGRNKFTEVIEVRNYSPSALNGWLRVLKTISTAMSIEYELPRDPAKGLRLFPEDVAFTPDNPNALSPEGNEIGEFISLMKVMYPQHFAITLLGFAIGHRPSTLRPLRRKGPTPDLLFNEDGTARLIVRRSNSRGQEIMESTKTRAVIVVDLPKVVADVLKDHIAELNYDPVSRVSDLLFPSHVTGEVQSKSALQKPFKNVAKALGLTKRITPKAMRRSFKDIARAAGVEAVVRKAVSGHATDRMEDHYSTAGPGEKKAAVAAVVSIATARAKRAASEG